MASVVLKQVVNIITVSFHNVNYFVTLVTILRVYDSEQFRIRVDGTAGRCFYRRTVCTTRPKSTSESRGNVAPTNADAFPETPG